MAMEWARSKEIWDLTQGEILALLIQIMWLELLNLHEDASLLLCQAQLGHTAYGVVVSSPLDLIFIIYVNPF
jgi:hypothetical protein